MITELKIPVEGTTKPIRTEKFLDLMMSDSDNIRRKTEEHSNKDGMLLRVYRPLI